MSIEFIPLGYNMITVVESNCATRSRGEAMHYRDRIRALREDHDRTQSEIAGLLNVGQRTYADYELGKTRIPVDSLIKLAKYYDVDMNYISGVSSIKNPYPMR